MVKQEPKDQRVKRVLLDHQVKLVTMVCGDLLVYQDPRVQPVKQVASVPLVPKVMQVLKVQLVAPVTRVLQVLQVFLVQRVVTGQQVNQERLEVTV